MYTVPRVGAVAIGVNGVKAQFFVQCLCRYPVGQGVEAYTPVALAPGKLYQLTAQAPGDAHPLICLIDKKSLHFKYAVSEIAATHSPGQVGFHIGQ